MKKLEIHFPVFIGSTSRSLPTAVEVRSKRALLKAMAEHKVTIGDNCVLGDCHIGYGTSIGDRCILSECTINQRVKVGSWCNILGNSFLFKGSRIEDNVDIERGVIVGDRSVIREGSRLRENCRVGNQTEICQESVLDSWSVVQDKCRLNLLTGESLPMGAIIPEGLIVTQVMTIGGLRVSSAGTKEQVTFSMTQKGIYVATQRFEGSLEEFRNMLSRTHPKKRSLFRQDVDKAISYVCTHFRLNS